MESTRSLEARTEKLSEYLPVVSTVIDLLAVDPTRAHHIELFKELYRKIQKNEITEKNISRCEKALGLIQNVCDMANMVKMIKHFKIIDEYTPVLLNVIEKLEYTEKTEKTLTELKYLKTLQLIIEKRDLNIHNIERCEQVLKNLSNKVEMNTLMVLNNSSSTHKNPDICVIDHSKGHKQSMVELTKRLNYLNSIDARRTKGTISKQAINRSMSLKRIIATTWSDRIIYAREDRLAYKYKWAVKAKVPSDDYNTLNSTFPQMSIPKPKVSLNNSLVFGSEDKTSKYPAPVLRQDTVVQAKHSSKDPRLRVQNVQDNTRCTNQSMQNISVLQQYQSQVKSSSSHVVTSHLPKPHNENVPFTQQHQQRGNASSSHPVKSQLPKMSNENISYTQVSHPVTTHLIKTSNKNVACTLQEQANSISSHSVKSQLPKTSNQSMARTQQTVQPSYPVKSQLPKTSNENAAFTQQHQQQAKPSSSHLIKSKLPSNTSNENNSTPSVEKTGGEKTSELLDVINSCIKTLLKSKKTEKFSQKSERHEKPKKLKKETAKAEESSDDWLKLIEKKVGKEKAEKIKALLEDKNETAEKPSSSKPFIEENIIAEPPKKRGRKKKELKLEKLDETTRKLSSSKPVTEENRIPEPPKKRGRKKKELNLEKLNETAEKSSSSKPVIEENVIPEPPNKRGRKKKENKLEKLDETTEKPSSSKSVIEKKIIPEPPKSRGRKNEVDKLNDDIKEMFIRDDILKLTKRRKISRQNYATDNLLSDSEHEQVSSKVVLNAALKNIDPSVHLQSKFSTNCCLCDYVGKKIVFHYIDKHSNTEVFTSRFNPRFGKDVLVDPFAKEGDLDDNGEIQSNSKIRMTCKFCAKEKTLTVTNWKCHLMSHTGEFKCKTCRVRHSNPGVTKIFEKNFPHMNGCTKDGFSIDDVHFENGSITAFLCKLCNFVQLRVDSVIDHLISQHENVDRSNVFEFEILNYKVHEQKMPELTPEVVLDPCDTDHTYSTKINMNQLRMTFTPHTALIASSSSSVVNNFNKLKVWTNKVSVKSDEAATKMLEDGKTLLAFFKCMMKHCTFATNNEAEATYHFVSHENEELFECSYCNSSFEKSSAILTHLTTIHLTSLFQCANCFYRACTSYHVFIHQGHYHSEKPKKIILGSYGLQASTANEMRLIETNKIKFCPPLICSICEQRFFVLKWYEEHIATHPVARIECQACKVEIPKAEIVDHLYKHRIGMFECVHCFYGTSDINQIRLHMSSVHPNKLLVIFSRQTKYTKKNSLLHSIESATISNIGATVDNEMIFKDCELQ